MKHKGYYIPVLAYHQISPNEWYYNDDQQFAEHMKWLYENGYTPVSLKTYYDYWTGKIKMEDMPDKPVFICFDDARDGVYDYAFPILKQYNFQFTVFVISKVVGDTDFVTWDQLREMVASGLCTLGNHTKDLHYFELEGPNAETWGALATKIWKDNGIYAYDKNITATRLENGGNNLGGFWGIPIAGTAKNYETNELYPIETYLGFKATKTMDIDRIIMKCPTHIPGEVFYDVKVKVSIGEKSGVTDQRNPIVVNPNWEPKHEPVDLVNTEFGETWVNGRYDVIHFNAPYHVVEGTWYNIRLQTLNMDNEQKEMRIYMNPTEIPFEEKNCATNSQSTDYNTVEGWAIHHGMPMIILSDGTGQPETYEEYKDRIVRDTQELKRNIEEYAGNCVTRIENPVLPMGEYTKGYDTAIPLYGASWKIHKRVPYYDEEGNLLFVDDIYEDFTRVKSFFKVRFNKSFTTKKIICDPVRWYGRPYVGIFNVYFGPWNGPSASELTLKKKGYFPIVSWDNVKRLEIKLDEEIIIQSGIDYCLHFETYNQDYWMGENKDGNPEVKNIEGVFRVGGKQIHYPEGVAPSKVTAYWNVADAGDGYKANETDEFVQADVWPAIYFYEEQSTYPEGKYEPPVWAIAFPFGAYTDDVNEIQKEMGMELQFTINRGYLDTRPNRNEAAVTDLLQCPRVMMINNTFMPPFSELVKVSTLELFQPKGPSPNVKKYAWVITREWGCNSLVENWRDIDVAIFDCYNFTDTLAIEGEPNFIREWWQQDRKKPAYAMFGNFTVRDNFVGFDPEIPTKVFNDLTTVDAVYNTIVNNNWDGVSIDFEEVKASDREAASTWFKALANKLHNNGSKYYELIVAAPYPEPNEPEWEKWFDYRAIARVSDRIVPMTYLDHGSWMGPGPISNFAMFKKRYQKIIEMGVPPYRLAGGLGVFGCRWDYANDFVAEQNMLEMLPLLDGKELPELDSEADEWHIKSKWAGEIWFQAPNTFHNRINWLREQGINAIAIWKLDDDDFSFWKAGFGNFNFQPPYQTFQIK